MLLDQDFKIVGPISLEKINKLRDLSLETDWTDYKFDRFERALTEGRLCTLPYPIRSEDQKVYTEAQQKLIDLAMPIATEVCSYHPALVPLRGEIVNLFPGKELVPHIDIHWFHKYSKRIHVPIYTNDQCAQIFESREYHLPVGYAYEINNRIKHSARNSGTTHRIHIIIDLITVDRLLELKNDRTLALTEV